MNNSKKKTKCWTIILKEIIKLASDIPWYAKKNEKKKVIEVKMKPKCDITNDFQSKFKNGNFHGDIFGN